MLQSLYGSGGRCITTKARRLPERPTYLAKSNTQYHLNSGCLEPLYGSCCLQVAGGRLFSSRPDGALPEDTQSSHGLEPIQSPELQS